MELIEQKISSEELYKSASYSFRVDSVRLPDGKTGTREVVKHPGGVAVLAIDDGKVALVRQYRYAIDRITTEIPAGKLDKIPGEKPVDAARRELREETGCIADSMEYLGMMYPSPGIITETLYIFYARRLQKTRQELDDDEFLNVEWLPVDTLLKQIGDGEINDCKAILSVPCCQHEINSQLENNIKEWKKTSGIPKDFAPLLKYGIVKERFSALLTDALRCESLEGAGYSVQLLEFIDMEHTPKNILIRAVKKKESGSENGTESNSKNGNKNISTLFLFGKRVKVCEPCIFRQ